MRDDDVVRSPDTQREVRVPPGQKTTEKWPVLHNGSVPRIDISRWTFTIFGLVDKERSMTYEEFGSLPKVRVHSDVHCVTGWSRLNNLWEGVSTAVIRELVGVLADAKFVTVHAAHGFTTNLSFDEFFQPDVLFALKHDGELLKPEHGYPMRLIVPRLYFWKSAKWVTGVEFTAQDVPGYWESRGYHNRGDPWREERYT